MAETEIGMPSASGPTSDFSAVICITTRPSGLIRGMTCMIMPTCWYRMLFVWPNWSSVTPRDRRHVLADLDVARLTVEGHDLRPAEHFQPPLFLQRPQQHAHAVARRREHEPAEAQVGVDAAHREVRKPLRGHVAGRRQRRRAAVVAQRRFGLLKLKPG